MSTPMAPSFGPRGTPHCFQNVGDTPGRLLVISTPSGLERFFEQFAELLPGQVDRDGLADVGHANWIEFVGPPLAVSDPIWPVRRLVPTAGKP
ncbi:MAG: hypothetical protein JWP64_4708 [Pseudonocardia sp.]|jgi:hypothetical protein|uniref:hypothetical protein n=1 Tax=Pseudonocardia sp. TaxID=60912 RepID=UPI00260F368E|nr:hypothetical protein [Pseudonocardia sp.]MCU1629759.1 hypothetical protein [Pseudonocardia sp.]MDT7697861.1 hypothetical protein [Pseudonocardiales bacterium]